MENIIIDKDRCNLCGICTSVCPKLILKEGDNAVTVTDPDVCILCGHCKAICSENAPLLPSLNEEEFEPFPSTSDLPRPEQLMALLRSRRSLRIFRKDPVEREKLERIIQAGRFAPTGGNRQTVRYVAIQSAERLDAIRPMTIKAILQLATKIENAMTDESAKGKPLPVEYEVLKGYTPLWRDIPQLLQQGIDKLFYYAPALIICHVNPKETVFAEVDASLSAMQMVLMAELLGLGTCFSGFFVLAIRESPDLRKVLQIPEQDRVVISFMVGYPDVTFLKLVSRKPAQVRWL